MLSGKLNIYIFPRSAATGRKKVNCIKFSQLPSQPNIPYSPTLLSSPKSLKKLHLNGVFQQSQKPTVLLRPRFDLNPFQPWLHYPLPST